MFNVTVQNHGGYVGNRGFVDTDIQVTNSMLSSDEVEQYVTLAKKSDEAFEELIKYFEKVDEPTIIVCLEITSHLLAQIFTVIFSERNR